jgi:hypothetical protein
MKLSRIEVIMLGLMASVVCLVLVVAAGIAINLSSAPAISVQQAANTPKPTETLKPAASPNPTETQPAATGTPTSILTSATTGSAASSISVNDRVNALLLQLDEPWGRQDWPQVIDILGRARTIDSANQVVNGKLYVAYYSYGQLLLARGQKSDAVLQFQNALGIRPSGIEAQQALANLTPTPTATSKPAPTNTPVWTPTLAMYNRVQNGMTYNQVVAILGYQIPESSRSAVGGSTSIFYDWSSPRGTASLHIMTTDGRVVLKSERGLQ